MTLVFPSLKLAKSKILLLRLLLPGSVTSPLRVLIGDSLRVSAWRGSKVIFGLWRRNETAGDDSSDASSRKVVKLAVIMNDSNVCEEV